MLNFTFLCCLEVVVVLWLETNKAKKNGFLSLQLELRLKLGFRLRLTNITDFYLYTRK